MALGVVRSLAKLILERLPSPLGVFPRLSDVARPPGNLRETKTPTALVVVDAAQHPSPPPRFQGLDPLGQPEVEDLDVPVPRDEHVLGLEVPVDDSALVRRRESLRDLEPRSPSLASARSRAHRASRAACLRREAP